MNPLLRNSQLIISSPYTRALQTAAIIAGKTGLDINVELDIHEFIPDKSFRVRNEAENIELHRDFLRCRGEYPPGESRSWETISEIIARTKPVFDKYLDMGCSRIIAVTHGGVIRRYTGIADIGHCQVIEIDYEKDFECFGWV